MPECSGFAGDSQSGVESGTEKPHIGRVGRLRAADERDRIPTAGLAVLSEGRRSPVRQPSRSRPAASARMLYVEIVAGFALLLVGGEAVVRGAVGLAQKLGVSPLIIGLTIVGFGTSLPEMVVSVNAAIVGSAGIAIGNVVGSNIANTLMILGVSAVLAPIAVHPKAVSRDTMCMLAATLVFCALSLSGELNSWHGIAMLILLAAYIGFTVWHDDKTHDAVAELHREEAEEIEKVELKTPYVIAIILIGMFAVVAGAEWLVDGASGLARQMGVPDEIIGLTIVAVGTSLPELATSFAAAWRGHSDVCVGNVIGSNIFNLFGIAGITTLFATLPFSDQIIGFDLPCLVLATVIILPFMLTGLRINRIEGGILFALYGVYLTSQFVGMKSFGF